MNFQGILSKKVAGVPVIYVAAILVAILAVIAWRMEPASEPVSEAEPGDAAATAGGKLTPTITDEYRQPMTTAAPEPDTNAKWQMRAVQYLTSLGYQTTDAQLAIQEYLAGSDLNVWQTEMANKAVTAIGQPPEPFVVGASTFSPPPVGKGKLYVPGQNNAYPTGSQIVKPSPSVSTKPGSGIPAT